MTNKTLIAEFVTALNNRNLTDLDRYLAPGVIDHNKIIHGEPDEPGAAFDAFRQQLDAFGELSVQPQDVIAEDDRVVVRVIVRGRHTGNHPRMPRPTNRTFSVEQIWIFTVSGGRIGEIRAVSDRLGMFAQLGWDWPDA